MNAVLMTVCQVVTLGSVTLLLYVGGNRGYKCATPLDRSICISMEWCRNSGWCWVMPNRVSEGVTEYKELQTYPRVAEPRNIFILPSSHTVCVCWSSALLQVLLVLQRRWWAFINLHLITCQPHKYNMSSVTIYIVGFMYLDHTFYSH